MKELTIAVLAVQGAFREHEDMLRRLGCTYGQGYFYAKPMPQEDFERFLETHLN